LNCFLLYFIFVFVDSLSADSLDKSATLNKPKISIVIDDLGDNSIIAKQMLSLPAKMTAAILPQTPHAEMISEFATLNGHDVIMHLPMEAFTRPDLLGPGALFSNMDQQTFKYVLEQNIASIPNIIGFNNHMGSLLTEDEEKMQWLMQEAKNQSFLFLDSKTSQDSVAEDIANQTGVPTIGRDIFLDHKGVDISIPEQFNKAKKIAHKIGKVVIICHPYPETLDFLREQLAGLEYEFELVGLGDLTVDNSQKLDLSSSAK